MDSVVIFHSEMFRLVILPFAIFFARICDVSLDTLRIIYVSRGLKFLAAQIGFIEVLIWLMAISQIISNLSNPFLYIAYAGGFAMGNYIGIIIEEKMAIGTVVIRVITQKDAMQLIEVLKAEGYGITYTDAQGAMGQVKIIFTIVKRKDVGFVLNIIKRFNPLAFYTIEDVRSVSQGVFPVVKKRGAL